MKKILPVTLKILAVPALLLAILYGAVNLVPNKALLTRSVAHFTKGTDYAVTIGRIRGDVFSRFSIDRLTVSDPKGVWLTLEQVTIAWNPLALATGGHVLDVVLADRIDLNRLPAPKKETEEPPQQSDEPFNPYSLLRYIPHEMALRDVLLGNAITGEARQFGVYMHRKNDRHRVLLQTPHNPQTALLAVIGLHPSDITADLSLAEEPNGLIGLLARLPDTPLAATIAIRTDRQQVTRITTGRITAGPSTLRLDGEWDQTRQHLDARLNLDLPDLAAYATLAGTKLSGALQAELSAKGTLDALDTHLHLTSPHLVAATLRLSDTVWNNRATLNLSDRTNLAFDTTGQLDSVLQQQDKPGLYRLANRYDARGDMKEIHYTLETTAQTPYGPSEATLAGTAHPADRLFAATLDALLTHQQKRYTLSAAAQSNPETLTLEKLALDGPGMKAGGSGTWQMESKRADGTLAIDIPDLRPLADILALPASGAFRAKAVFTASEQRQLADVTIDALRLTYQDQTIRLRRAAALTIDDDRITLSPFTLEFPGGSVVAEGMMDKESVNASFRTTGLDLYTLLENEALKGKADARLTLSGTPARPVARFNTTFNGTSGDYPVTLRADGNWQENRLHVDAKATSTDTTATLNADLNARLSLMPFETDLSADTSLNGRLQARMNLEILNPMLWATRQQIAGMLSGNAQLGGILKDPKFNGRFQLENGDYQHTASGLCVNKLRATVTASNQQITIQDLSSTNSPNDRLTAQARLGLTGNKPLSGDITFRQYQLFCGGLATGILDGQLRAGGNVQSSAIDGKLTLGPINVQLPGAQNTGDIPEVETLRLTRKRAVRDTPRSMRLNIALDAPNQIFIRGRGLDAEFGGNLLIKGEATDPAINGEFKARRGRFTLLDRNLELANAVLRFEGQIPPSPYLDIQAKSIVNGTTITVNLQGPATKPKLNLTSSPTLPNDEVLALLLFGRQLQNISPFQAIRLAQAARTLAGLDGGKPGVLDQARAKLGLDTLDIGTSDDNSVTVSTGKYVTDSVFVGVQQGAKPEDKQVKTEIELSPSVSANTTLDAEGNQGFGLGWRYDY